VSYRDLGVGGEHTRDGVYRPDQAELSVAECSEVPAITLVEFYVCQVARPQSHLVDHVGEDIDGSDQADEWRQGQLYAPDPTTDVEHRQIQTQQLPLGQTRHDLTGGDRNKPPVR